MVDSSWRAFQSASDLCAAHRLQIWNALIVSVAAERGCRLRLTEDMQPGFTWRGVTIVNPYVTSIHCFQRTWNDKTGFARQGRTHDRCSFGYSY